MRASSRLKLLFALLFALSTAGKVIADGRSRHGTEETIQSTAKDRIATTLGRHGFRVEKAEALPDSPFVPAVAGDCRLLVVLAAPGGWHRDITHRLASPQDQVFFVFDGVMYRDQPKWLPWVHQYWHALNLHVGRKLAARPLLGVVGSPDCDPRVIPWRELAEL